MRKLKRDGWLGRIVFFRDRKLDRELGLIFGNVTKAEFEAKLTEWETLNEEE